MKYCKLLNDPEPVPMVRYEQKGDELVAIFHDQPIAVLNTSKLSAEEVQMWKNKVAVITARVEQHYVQYPEYAQSIARHKPRNSDVRVSVRYYRANGTVETEA